MTEPKPARGFHNLLRAARLRVNLSQVEAAAKAGVDAIQWSKWETGKALPSLLSLRKICIALDCKSDFLLNISPSIGRYEVPLPTGKKERKKRAKPGKVAKNKKAGAA